VAWLRTLSDLERVEDATPPDSVVAIVTVRGTLHGVTRSAEHPMSILRLKSAADALTQHVQADSLAAWRVNYWKYVFCPLLAPQAGWHLAGR